MVFQLLSGFVSLAAALAAAQPVDFRRDVRPILSDACFHCHGPDQSTRMAGLRLDTAEAAFAPRKNGAAIVPGKPAASAAWKRITAEPAARRMPPPYSHKSLTAEQKETIRKWIEQGAPWKEHWAYVPLRRPPPPAVKDKSWARSELDRFVLARLESAGLKPAPLADRRTLLRRVALDLTGLPPTPEEVEAFVSDPAPDAYERVVDRLLASPHWGEHRARYWLDAARYGDTHGIHIDNYREMWPYRDWVIQAFNRNLPFDRFVIEQLAGDMLPDRTLDQQIASGFQRCNVTTNEAGVIIEEVEAMYAKDRVETVGSVFLGLTLGCASCHDHKFDPLTQRDFYSMTAFFRNTTQNAMDGNIYDTPPIVVVPRPEDRARWEAIGQDQAATRRRMSDYTTPAAFAQWLVSGARRATAPISGERFALNWEALALPDGIKPGPADLPNRRALHFTGKAALDLEPLAISADRPFAVAARIYVPKTDESLAIASQSDPNDKNRGWALEIGARVVGFRLTGDEGKSIVIRAGHLEQVKPGQWYHIAASYDGSRDQLGLALYIDGRAIPTQSSGDIRPTLKGELSGRLPLRLGGEGRRYFPGGAIADFRVFERALSEEEAWLVSRWRLIEDALAKPAAELTREEREAVRLYWLHAHDDGYRALVARDRELARERRDIRARSAITHVMEERAHQKPFAHILHRGMYDQPRDRVEPDVPAVLPPLAPSFERNRLGLARWLVSPENPLTARVTVNRFWQELFGVGLVRTTEDFGSQGEAPSHPELLDWLAVEFRDSGWDVKRFYRMLVTSAAYRQSAATTPEKLARDPENRLLSRGPRFRVDAETVRDYALAASGLLVRDIGGPSVKPYQPDGIWEAVAMLGSNTRFYERDKGPKLYRRSLYTFWKRAAPPASMEIFNAPTREACTVRRERTNTPLQALVTMNDVQFIEAARHLAGRAWRAEPSDLDRRLDFLARHILARSLDAREIQTVRRSYRDFLRHYDSNPIDARNLIHTGESKPATGIPPADYAALTLVANQLFNLDEALTK